MFSSAVFTLPRKVGLFTPDRRNHSRALPNFRQYSSLYHGGNGSRESIPQESQRMIRYDCALLFSGGTDSTCAAAICAESHEKIHLLTFYESSTKNSPIPQKNLDRLRKHFGDVKFSLFVISTDELVRKIAYENYIANLLKHGFFMLCTPGFSSLSWHLHTIKYCLDNGIKFAYDGMTKELMHLPGHMPVFRNLITELYRSFGINFCSPVIDWPVPPDQRFMDRLIVDRHGFVAHKNALPEARTTGQYLFEREILPHPNVKGSQFDREMQHDCYPFLLFNIFVFWYYLSHKSEKDYAWNIENLFRAKIQAAKRWLEEARGGASEYSVLFSTPEKEF